MKSEEQTVKVLLVDDDSTISEVIEKKLVMSGYQVASTINSTQALPLAKEFGPDVIVLDLMMTRMTGEEVLAQLKEEPDVKKIPVLVFTNKGLAEDEQTFLEAGAAQFLIKSDTSLDELVEAVQRLSKK